MKARLLTESEAVKKNIPDIRLIGMQILVLKRERRCRRATHIRNSYAERERQRGAPMEAQWVQAREVNSLFSFFMGFGAAESCLCVCVAFSLSLSPYLLSLSCCRCCYVYGALCARNMVTWALLWGTSPFVFFIYFHEYSFTFQSCIKLIQFNLIITDLFARISSHSYL